jgi:predicted amino acid racemase
MLFPRLTIDRTRITGNVRKVLDACGAGVEVLGVTKGAAGDVEVARALLAGGLSALGDSRLRNLDRLRLAGLGVPLWLLRSPAPSEVASAVGLAEASLQSDRTVLRLVAEEARRRGKRHGVLLMVDLGTGREGFEPEELGPACAEAEASDALELLGLGLYFDFRSDDHFQRRTIGDFAALAASLERKFRFLSAGASNVLASSVLEGELPPGMNHLRCGTAPLLGISSSHGPRVIPGFDRATFLLEALVIETKKSKREAILALGSVDAPMEHLHPTEPGIALLRSSSDHTVLDFTRASPSLRAGDAVRFRLGYPALARLMSSPYTAVVYR